VPRAGACDARRVSDTTEPPDPDAPSDWWAPMISEPIEADPDAQDEAPAEAEEEREEPGGG